MLLSFLLAFSILGQLCGLGGVAASSLCLQGEHERQVPLAGCHEPSRHPYGFWESPITPDWIVTQGNPIEDVFVDKVTGKIYYTERLPEEGGRNVIKDYDTKAPVFQGDYNARTRVHEYGGGQNVAFNGVVYFSNLPDDRVYEVNPSISTTPRPVTSPTPGWRYADFDVNPSHTLLAAVAEIHGVTVDNLLTVINVHSGATFNVDFLTEQDSRTANEPRPHFVDSPRFSPDGKHLVARVWYHPHMSWEASELWLVDIDMDHANGVNASAVPKNPRRIVGDRINIAVGEPNWVSPTVLLYTSDIDGYVNPWYYDLEKSEARPLALSPIPEDFAEAGWTLGLSNAAMLDETRVVYSSFKNGRSQFYIFDLADGSYRTYPMAFAYASKLRSVSRGTIVFLAKWDTRSTSIVLASIDLNDLQNAGWALYSNYNFDIPSSYISLPNEFVFQDPETGDPVHATYYPPKNPNYMGGLSGELPPVVVHVHGGPTSFTPQGLNWDVQLFTTRGFGWVNINYGGSVNYGRAYRERLLGQWGVVDVRDSITAVRELGRRGLVDPARAVIRGGSAGGFTTLAALATSPGTFAAGTSMYGVSDLRTLQAVLHKFESHYLLKYVGGTPETDPELWWERSPISHAEDINVPLLILQGADDTVVPVDQATEMLEVVRQNGGTAELHIFEGEGHGWRQAKTVREALKLELDWYQRIFRAACSTL